MSIIALVAIAVAIAGVSAYALMGAQDSPDDGEIGMEEYLEGYTQVDIHPNMSYSRDARMYYVTFTAPCDGLMVAEYGDEYWGDTPFKKGYNQLYIAYIPNAPSPVLTFYTMEE